MPTLDGDIDAGIDATASDPEPDIGLRLDLDAAMATLSPEHRSVVVLRDVMGHDYETIAELLDVPVGTVRSRLARARGALMRAFDTVSENDGADDSGNFPRLDDVEPHDRAGFAQPPRTTS